MDGFYMVVSILLPFMLVMVIVVCMMIGAAWLASLVTVAPLGRVVIFVLLLAAGIWLLRKLCAKYNPYD